MLLAGLGYGLFATALVLALAVMGRSLEVLAAGAPARPLPRLGPAPVLRRGRVALCVRGTPIM